VTFSCPILTDLLGQVPSVLQHLPFALELCLAACVLSLLPAGGRDI
jgi:hypothetical protein